jgi:hypothetical protein
LKRPHPRHMTVSECTVTCTCPITVAPHRFRSWPRLHSETVCADIIPESAPLVRSRQCTGAFRARKCPRVWQAAGDARRHHWLSSHPSAATARIGARCAEGLGDNIATTAATNSQSNLNQYLRRYTRVLSALPISCTMGRRAGPATAPTLHPQLPQLPSI